jgi:uncharacterized protein (UPF0335 family)
MNMGTNDGDETDQIEAYVDIPDEPNKVPTIELFVRAIKNLEDDKAQIAEAVATLYGTAKEYGFNTKLIRKSVALLHKGEDERTAEVDLLDTAMSLVADVEDDEA